MTQNVNSVPIGTGHSSKIYLGDSCLVDMFNATLCDPTMKKVNFIGVINIAGSRYLSLIPPQPQYVCS
jgi:hypothetical protein